LGNLEHIIQQHDEAINVLLSNKQTSEDITIPEDKVESVKR